MSTRIKVSGVTGSIVIALIASFLFVMGAGGQKTPPKKPEDVVEEVIYAYGSRPAIYGIQRNGVIKSNLKLTTPDGVREGIATNKFIRKPKLTEDHLILTLEFGKNRFVIGFDGKQGWTQSNGELQDPPPAETIAAFRNAHAHSYETLLRYKENDAKVAYAGSRSFGPNNELDLIDLTLPDGTKTRYEVSRKFRRIIYLEYDDQPAAPEAKPIKYRLYFKDFRAIQNTLVPYDIQVFRDGVLSEERKLVEVAYNVQLEESAFKPENANKATEANKRANP